MSVRTRFAAWLVAAGALLSGPVASLVVHFFAPQPPWAGIDAFAAAYHPLQTLPYLLGYVLLAGFALFSSACHAAAAPRHKARTGFALVFTAVYASLVFTNYTLQVAFVPKALGDGSPLVAVATMANPDSFAWSLEMFGYAALGVATFAVAPLFDGARRGRAIRRLLELNGVVSVIGAICTAAFSGWILSVWGLLAFAVWNTLIVVCFLLMATVPQERLA